MAGPNLLRMMQLFKPNQEFEDATRIPNYEPPEPVNMNSGGGEIENESLRRFLGMPMPERKNPSTLAKIGATLMSLRATPDMVDKSLHANYYRDMDDYTNKSKPLLDAARIESTQQNYNSLNNYRSAQNATANKRIDVTANTADKRITSTEKLGNARNDIARGRAEATARNNDERIKIANAKLTLDQQKARLQGATLKAVPGGNFVWFMPDGKRLDTGVESGSLSDTARMAI
jgi:hypothetical protein